VVGLIGRHPASHRLSGRGPVSTCNAGPRRLSAAGRCVDRCPAVRPWHPARRPPCSRPGTAGV
jgi:hypothetical protein